MNNIHMYAALAHGAPEWWTGPEQTGHQLLESGAFAEQFMAEKTTADLVEIRRIVFQMLGMDHLVVFINVCSNYLQPDVDTISLSGNMIIWEKQHTKALHVALAKAKAAKKKIFDVLNIHRLLWFALECGLDLGPTARHATPSEFYKQQISPFDLRSVSLRRLASCTTMNTIEMLTQLRLWGSHIDDAVTSTVLSFTTFNADPIFDESKTIVQPRTRLHVHDSGSAVWHKILNMMFVYHQSASPASSSLEIMAECLSEIKRRIPTVVRVVIVNRYDEQRRMLPYLLRKPDLNDGSLILKFCDTPIDVDYIVACAELCKDHPNWPQTCVMLIDRFINCEHFIANVNKLCRSPGMNQMTMVEITAYVTANVKLDDVHELSIELLQLVVRYSAFDTKSSIDCVLKMFEVNDCTNFISKLAVAFAYRLGLTRPVAVRVDMYKRHFSSGKYSKHHGAMIHYLMHNEDSYVKCKRLRHCNLELDTLQLDTHTTACDTCEITAQIAANVYLVRAPHKLCKMKLYFDSLILLINRRYPCM